MRAGERSRPPIRQVASSAASTRRPTTDAPAPIARRSWAEVWPQDPSLEPAAAEFRASWLDPEPAGTGHPAAARAPNRRPVPARARVDRSDPGWARAFHLEHDEWTKPAHFAAPDSGG